MSYQVIARKWRPMRFADMVGQEHIARTLKNTIISGRIAHAYLFVGPRGIGKTTSARIFAKALNCIHPVDGEPCCQCSSCKAIANESSVDVIEIDAATHTQVDKAREICEDVLHLPIASKYKIYIIDEVHMLSKSAWNALLKTIEEPPAHAKFIFATTEVNKVLPTVISRCQRFDLRRIHTSDIAGRLRYISDQEHVNISDSAIRVIAQAADGGMRDAQSLLDQLISFFGADSANTISEEQALSLFGLTAPAEMEALLRSILSNDREGAIISIHRFSEQGKNLETLFEEMIAWLRGILLCRILRSPQGVLDESPEKLEVYRNLGEKIRVSTVQRLVESLSASGYLLREAINKQVFIESILLKSMRIAHSVQIEDLIARLNQIRQTGELNALESVVPLYEVPVQQIVASANSGFPAIRSSSAESAGTQCSLISAETATVAVGPSDSKQTEGQQSHPMEVTAVSDNSASVQNTAETTPPPQAKPAECSIPQTMNPIPSATHVTAPSKNDAAAGETEPPETASRSEAEDRPPWEPAQRSDRPETKSNPVPSPADQTITAAPAPSDDAEIAEKENEVGGEPEEIDAPDVDTEIDTAETDAPVTSRENFARVRRGSTLGERYEAEEIWQKLILEVRDVLNRVLLAAYMAEGLPEGIQRSTLIVAFDSEYEEICCQMVERDLQLLVMRLRMLSECPDAGLRIIRKPGIASPAQVKQKISAEELKVRAAQSPLVQKSLGLFGGRLVDAHLIGEEDEN